MSTERRAQRDALRKAERELEQRVRDLVAAASADEEISPFVQSFGDDAQDGRQREKVAALLRDLGITTLRDLGIPTISRVQAKCSVEGVIGDTRALVQTARGPATLVARWVRETGPYQPSTTGEWRVNPNSLALRDPGLAGAPLERPTVSLPVMPGARRRAS